MFYGEYVHTLDEKNRFILPARFRETALFHGINTFYLTRGLDRCLFLFPDREWCRQEEAFRSLPLTSKEARRFNRVYFSGAVEITMNKQGRVLIPAYLKDFAYIDREIVVIGVSSRIEIWAYEKWKEFYDSAIEDFEDIAEHLINPA